MVEYRVQPVHGGVAERAVRGESGGDVIRIRSGIECRNVAGGALRGQAHKLVVDVALLAGGGKMHASQWKAG